MCSGSKSGCSGVEFGSFGIGYWCSSSGWCFRGGVGFGALGMELSVLRMGFGALRVDLAAAGTDRGSLGVYIDALGVDLGALAIHLGVRGVDLGARRVGSW